MDDQSFTTFWMLIVEGFSLLVGFGGVHRIWIRPLIQREKNLLLWRSSVDSELKSLKKNIEETHGLSVWQKGVEGKLTGMCRTFDNMGSSVTKMDEKVDQLIVQVAKVETALEFSQRPSKD